MSRKHISVNSGRKGHRPTVTKRVLAVLGVAEDEFVARLVQVTLERQGHSVVVARGATDAREKVVSERPDLIVLDETTAEGQEAVRMLQEDAATREIPVASLKRPWRRGRGGPGSVSV